METNKKENSKRILYAVVVVLAVANFAFKLLTEIKIEQTSILFVGIPALITLLLIKYAETPKSAYGVVFRTLTLFLLFASVLLGEGLVCIIFMAPIFYAVAGIIVFIGESLKKKEKSNLKSYIIIPMLIIISQAYEINSDPEVLNIETKVELNNHSTLNSFNKIPDFLTTLPNFFKIGFPKPISIEGKGINIGDYRKIEFESNTKGIGILHLKVKEKNDNQITFEIVEDQTHINHWLSWKEITVTIENTNKDTSTITWNTKFTCDLGPSWYFKPIESYGVKVMNEHLINSFFVE